MHGKSQADQWQRYIHAKLSAALSKRSSWFLFGLAFLAVYREVFETILFYAALASQGSGGAVFGGFVTGLVLLAVIAWAMLPYSQDRESTRLNSCHLCAHRSPSSGSKKTKSTRVKS